LFLSQSKIISNLEGKILVNIQFLVREVEAYVQAHLGRYTEELVELCSIDSGSYDKSGLDEMARVLAARLRGLDMDVTIVSREQWGNDLLGVLCGDGGENVVLLGHMDTVYPVDTAVARGVRVNGNTMYGPGVIDMKGCILAAIYAIEALVVKGYRSFGEIRLLCVSDEEINIRHSQDLLQHIFQGCQAVLTLEGARENGNLVSARKGLAAYTLQARGVAAHAGVEPEKGCNAIVEIAHQIVQFYSLNGWRDGVTINPGIVSGGMAANVVPEHAEVMFELRFLEHQDRLATEAEWRKMMAHRKVPGVELALSMFPDMKEPMVCTAESMKLIEQAEALAHTLGFTLGHELTGGGGDAGYASKMGIPVLDGLGPIGGGNHSPREYLRLDSVPKRSALLAGLTVSVGSQCLHCWTPALTGM
jgi:glutamate carboxypeptidase